MSRPPSSSAGSGAAPGGVSSRGGAGAAALKDRHVLILGANQPMGERIARHLCQAGAFLTCAGHDGATMQSLAHSLTLAGGKAVAARFDPREIESLCRALERADQFRSVDIAILLWSGSAPGVSRDSHPARQPDIQLSCLAALLESHPSSRLIGIFLPDAAAQQGPGEDRNPASEEPGALEAHFAELQARLAAGGIPAHKMLLSPESGPEAEASALFLCAVPAGSGRGQLLDFRQP